MRGRQDSGYGGDTSGSIQRDTQSERRRARTNVLPQTIIASIAAYSFTHGQSPWDSALRALLVVGSLAAYSGYPDVYIVKTDEYGDTVWTRTIGGENSDEGHSVQQTFGGGYVITGSTLSIGAGNADVYLIRVDVVGNTLLTKTFGGPGNDAGYSVQQTVDSGFIIVGQTESLGGATPHVYLVKTDARGDTLWTRTYGGIRASTGHSVQIAAGGGYIIAGSCSGLVYLVWCN
jgi:hypothetical protein